MIDIRIGDCRELLATMPDQSAHCCVTSPPYFGLRDYGMAGQIGLEPTPDAFVAEMVALFRDVRRVLRDDGTLWLNLGDSYASGGQRQTGRNDTDRDTPGGRGGSFRGGVRSEIDSRDNLKPKDLIGIPWRVAFALQSDGWYLRQDIIWSKPNPMPESVTDRCTKAHEYLFLLSKGARYWYDADAIAEDATGRVVHNGNGGEHKHNVAAKTDDKFRYKAGLSALEGQSFETRNRRSVWTVATQPFSEAHFATFPPDLVEPCIKAGCPKGGTVLDPFGGAGTTGLVADRLGRNAVLIELNPEYAGIAQRRIQGDAGMFAELVVTV